jgi:pimeloyl-ACP methyl ester carboxylesterase
VRLLVDSFQAAVSLGIEGDYDYSFVAGTGHLLQVEKPQECARLTVEFLARHGLA